MKITELNLTGKLEDGTPISFQFPEAPQPAKKRILLNCINWGQAFQNMTLSFPSEATEYTYFVILVAKDGKLIFGSEPAEKRFIQAIKAMGKEATFSVGGGSQNPSDIASAITNTTSRYNFINQISDRMAWGYDGVTLDIENTNIHPDVMVAFLKALRAKLGENKIIGVYTQPYQLNTVWSKMELAEQYITWLSPMIYDFPNTVAEAKGLTLQWQHKLNGKRSKLLFGSALNYNATGLDLTELPQILDWINQENLGGIGIWNNEIYSQPYRDLVKSKLNF